MKFKSILIGLMMIFVIITSINPIYPEEQFLQHIGTLLIIIVLLIDARNEIFSKLSFLGIFAFGIIHIIGARYIYSYVPYQEFFNEYLGFNINQTFGFKRNHYDRMVHFSFGFFIFLSVYEYFYKKINISKVLALLIAWLVIQLFSMIYELFEWWLTLIMSESDAENYNGQQGDVWDAHKDMALALLGSSIVYIFCYIKLIINKQKM